MKVFIIELIASWAAVLIFFMISDRKNEKTEKRLNEQDSE